MNGDLPAPRAGCAGSAAAAVGSGEPAASSVRASGSRTAAPSSSRSTAVPMAAKLRALSGWVSFSAPTASAISAAPDATDIQASQNALDAEAQAFSTLTIGTPRTPVWRSADWPRIISWPVRTPAVALEKNATSTSDGAVRASARASAVASSASDRTERSMNLPKAVMPAPATSTSRISSSPPCSRRPRGPKFAA
jgi:hypothetical protein